MIESIRIKNLRSFVDTGNVCLKKLNVLLGANSSGKSTFLRSFPLFTQSINKNLRGPISWFDSSYVDFGDFQTAKNRYVPQEEPIVFSYQIKNPRSILRYYLYFDSVRFSISTKQLSDVNFSISYANDEIGTFVKEITIILGSIDYHYSINHRDDIVKLYISGKECPLPKCRWDKSTMSSIIPAFIYDAVDKDKPQSVGSILYKNIIDTAKKFCDGRLKHTEKLNPIIANWVYDKSQYLEFLQEYEKIHSFMKRARMWTVDTKQYTDLYNKVSYLYVYELIKVLNSEVSDFYNSCSYIAPLRAEANRYYRNQGLQVRDIDSNGRNLAEYIQSLSKSQRMSYDNFCSKLLGCKIETQSQAGHTCIVLKGNSNEGDNLMDVGFGYSQILPIITKIWHTAQIHKRIKENEYYRYMDSTSSVILMEQPELHLHPAMQAKLADSIIDLVEDCNACMLESRDSDDTFRVIIETHSPTIINRIGRRIREKKIKPEDVNILLFTKNNKETKLTHVAYNDKGQLVDWPYGFFDPNED